MQIEIGDWVCVPSRKFEGPHIAAQVVKFEGVRNGCERVVIKLPTCHPKSDLCYSYPILNVEKITEEQALLMIFER